MSDEDNRYHDCPTPECTGTVWWQNWPQQDGTMVQADTCGTCGTLVVRCAECGSLTGLHVRVQRCDGCEIVYEELVDHKGGFEGVRQVF